MVSDWDGRAEPFKIHPEGWAIIAVVAVALIALLIGN